MNAEGNMTSQCTCVDKQLPPPPLPTGSQTLSPHLDFLGAAGSFKEREDTHVSNSFPRTSEGCCKFWNRLTLESFWILNFSLIYLEGSTEQDLSFLQRNALFFPPIVPDLVIAIQEVWLGCSLVQLISFNILKIVRSQTVTRSRVLKPLRALQAPLHVKPSCRSGLQDKEQFFQL